jgi:hypothetical protein
VRYLAHRDFGIDINRCGLCFGNGGEGLYLAIVEARSLAIILKTYIAGVDPMELSQCSNCVMPPVMSQYSVKLRDGMLCQHFCSFGRRYIGHGRIFNDSPI